MSKTVTIAGDTGFDGTYPLDFIFNMDEYDGHEWHLIKQVSNVRAGEYFDSLAALDWDLMVAITVIALCRVQKVQMSVALQAAEMVKGLSGSKLVFDLEDPADAVPPPPTPTS